MRVLLTGGAGFIGSHLTLSLWAQGHHVTLLDDFSNSDRSVVERIEALGERELPVIEVDLAHREHALRALRGTEIDAVVHLAGVKSVAESVAEPLRYYRVNIDSTLNLLEAMREGGVERLVFSSSATVYGTPRAELVSEDHPVGEGLTNPYGRSKAMNEQILRDAVVAQPELQIAVLRYFNPVGAHPSGRLGEDPKGVPNNLLPLVAQVASGVRTELQVFGDGYPTPDGTGVRDYIHVMDLAEGHVAALEKLQRGWEVFNLGTGVGHSVLDVIAAFRAASDRPIPYRVAAVRPGDVPSVVADPTKASVQLGWQARRSLADACRDSWSWQTTAGTLSGSSA